MIIGNSNNNKLTENSAPFFISAFLNDSNVLLL